MQFHASANNIFHLRVMYSNPKAQAIQENSLFAFFHTTVTEISKSIRNSTVIKCAKIGFIILGYTTRSVIFSTCVKLSTFCVLMMMLMYTCAGYTCMHRQAKSERVILHKIIILYEWKLGNRLLSASTLLSLNFAF